MKTSLLFLSVFLSLSLFGQSKKKQIEMLMVSKDSIQSLLDNEREAHTSSKTALTNQIAELNNEINDLISNSDTQNARIENLESQLKKLETQLQIKEQEIFTQKKTIEKLNSELKNKSDSLLMLETELLNYKPKTKPKKPEEVEDIKSVYKTVRIGSQTWMTKNLNIDKFRNGDLIPQAKTNEEWEAAGKNKQPAWCYYYNDPKKGEKYGKLYNWYAVTDSRGLAPKGYHVPSDKEWTVLTDYLVGNSDAIKMKSKSGWYYGLNGNNESGFNGLPGGVRIKTEFVGTIGSLGFWWSATELDTSDAFGRRMYYNYGGVFRDGHDKADGFSVRCLKD